jgi:hypothetical protein
VIIATSGKSLPLRAKISTSSGKVVLIKLWEEHAAPPSDAKIAASLGKMQVLRSRSVHVRGRCSDLAKVSKRD